MLDHACHEIVRFRVWQGIRPVQYSTLGGLLRKVAAAAAAIAASSCNEQERGHHNLPLLIHCHTQKRIRLRARSGCGCHPAEQGLPAAAVPPAVPGQVEVRAGQG